MPQSHNHKCSCCDHHCPRHHHHRRHLKNRHSSSDEAIDSDVKVAKQPPARAGSKPGATKPEAKKLEERPWTLWMTGDGGRYYYRGRQKLTGEWEYHFMPAYSSAPHKYSPSSVSTVASAVSTTTSAPLIHPLASSYLGTGSNATMPTSYAASQISSAMSSMSLYPASFASASAALPTSAAAGARLPPATQHQSTTSRTTKQKWPTEGKARHHQHKENKHVRVTERSYRGSSHYHHHHHRSSSSAGKGIGTVVSANKDKKFSSKSRVSGWLDDVEEGEYGGSVL